MLTILHLARQIRDLVRNALAGQSKLESQVQNCQAALTAARDQLSNEITSTASLIAGQLEAQQNILVQMTATLAKIEKAVLYEPGPPVAAVLTVRTIGDETMQNKVLKAAQDLQLLDNGSAVATITFVDSVGEPTTAQAGATIVTVWTSSDPGVAVTGRADGLNADVKPTITDPNAALPTGVTLSASTTITNLDGTVLGPFTSTGDPIDVVAGGPAGTKITEA